eukprot:1853387-Karenia_brevis.AAC.1
MDHSLVQHLRDKHVSAEKQDSVAEWTAPQSCAHVAQHNWQEAYEKWKEAAYDGPLNHGVVPNAKQTEILRCIHE